MIKCKNCGYVCDYMAKPCPVCNAAMIIDREDMDNTRRELAYASEQKNIAKMHHARHLLADGGDVESMREYAKLVEKGIAEGCGVDAPGSYIAWLCGQSIVYAMEMPGKRYDIGNLESYEQVKKEYKGIC